MTMWPISEEQVVALKERMFEYLDNVRSSGITNMFGATTYVQAEFGLTKQEAKDVLVEWMQTFNARHPLPGDEQL